MSYWRALIGPLGAGEGRSAGPLVQWVRHGGGPRGHPIGRHCRSDRECGGRAPRPPRGTRQVPGAATEKLLGILGNFWTLTRPGRK
eukprot:8572224-Pyramimonas_sp.AAC.1